MISILKTFYKTLFFQNTKTLYKTKVSYLVNHYTIEGSFPEYFLLFSLKYLFLLVFILLDITTLLYITVWNPILLILFFILFRKPYRLESLNCLYEAYLNITNLGDELLEEK